MKLPAGTSIIGIITVDEEGVEGNILWDNFWFEQNKDIAAADIMNDVRGLAETQYNKAIAEMRNEQT